MKTGFVVHGHYSLDLDNNLVVNDSCTLGGKSTNKMVAYVAHNENFTADIDDLEHIEFVIIKDIIMGRDIYRVYPVIDGKIKLHTQFGGNWLKPGNFEIHNDGGYMVDLIRIMDRIE